MSSEKKVNDLYKEAIEQLTSLSEDPETDDSVRDEANAKIKVMRGKVQAAALDNIITRSANLQAFMSDLNGVIAKAGHSDISGQVASLRGLVMQAKGMMDMMKGM
ncbi:MAG: hypothetical protein WC969_12840 [Elusimicrobiota bacterium]|jgi:hypothetical protein